MKNKVAVLLVAAVFAAGAPAAFAVSYASGVTQVSTDVSFILNQDATNVSVVFDGGIHTLDLGALTKGTQGFSMAGYTSYKIQVASGSPGSFDDYTQFSDNDYQYSKFYSPKDVLVNKDPTSSNFGRIYVAEGLGGATGGETTTTGIYALNADQTYINQQNGGGVFDGTSNTPFRLDIDENNTVYTAGWGGVATGVWRMDAGLGNFETVMAHGQSNHTAISGIHVEGNDLYTQDESGIPTVPSTPGDITLYDMSGGLPVTADPTVFFDDWGTGNHIQNLRSDLARESDGSWWITQYRATEDAAVPALLKISADGSTILFNSADADLFTVDGPEKYPYGNMDILELEDVCDGQSYTRKLIVVNGRSDWGARVLDITDLDNVYFVDDIDWSAGLNGYIQGTGFDAAGNMYAVGSSNERMKIFSPGGMWTACTGSDGTFNVVPEPASLAFLALGGLAVLRRRR